MALDPAVSAFVLDLPDDRALLVQDMHEVIADHAPALLPPAIDGVSLVHGPYHYRYGSGREGDGYVIRIRNGAKHLSAYVAAVQGGSYVAEARADRLGKVEVGRSCIRIRRRGQLDLGVFGEIVRVAMEVGGEGQVS